MRPFLILILGLEQLPFIYTVFPVIPMLLVYRVVLLEGHHTPIPLVVTTMKQASDVNVR